MTHLPSGTYRPSKSLPHRIDPAVKLICFSLLIAAVLLSSTAPGYLAMVFVAAALSYLAQLEPGEALAGVKRLRWLLMLILFLNFVFAFPDKAFFRWWIFAPSVDGLVSGLEIVLRLSLILVLANVLSCTTAPLKLCGAIQTLLQPLKYIKVPTAHIALMITISLRFIPALFQELDEIRLAQQARGMRFEKPGFTDRANALKPLLVPLFMSALKKSGSLSDSVESRGYRMDGRGAVVNSIAPDRIDWAALLVCGAVFAMQLIIL